MISVQLNRTRNNEWTVIQEANTLNDIYNNWIELVTINGQ